jgi:tetratricopeptide (TPR) repeat protein
VTDAADEMMREAADLQRANRPAEAMSRYRAVVARWPQHAGAWYNLGVLERRASLYADALASYQRAISLGIPRAEEVHLNRGVIFSDILGDYPAAVRELRQALDLNPAYWPAVLNLANLYEDLGKRPEASALYARILENQPQAYEALARFANMQPAASVDPALIQRLRAALAEGPPPEARASLSFALGRLLDAAREYPEAFQAYAAANRASRAAAGGHVVPYDRARQEAFVDRSIASPRATVHAAASDSPPRPIFIVGMFRSGSTLAEQLLAGMPGVAAGGEISFLPRLVHDEITPFFETVESISAQRLDAMAARYRAELLRVSANASYVTDKRPDNFLYIGLIKRLFPDARIVHTRRNPLDNCLSVYFLHLEQQMSYALDLMDIGHYYREYRRLMDHWKTLYPDDIYDFDYDTLIAQPEPTLERLCEFLGLEWPGQVPKVATRSAAIRTASVWQVREPLYATSSGRSRNYATELAPLREYLAAIA